MRLKLTLALLAFSAMAAAQDTAIDVQRSTITIHVGKAGLFSAAGHDHTISAPISSGAIGESPAPHVEFTVETAKMPTGGRSRAICPCTASRNPSPWP